MEALHKKILRSNHKLIIENVALESSSVLDKLREDSVISSDEAEEIMDYGGQRQQTSHLLNFLKKKDQSCKPFHSFARALQNDYRDVAEKLLSDLKKSDSTTEEIESSSVMCIYCFLLKNLRPLKISQTLYQNGAFTDDELEEINNRKKPRRKRVKQMLGNLSKLNWNKTKIMHDILTGYLRKKFGCAYKTTTTNSIAEFTSCSCKRLQQKKKLNTRQQKDCSRDDMTIIKHITKVLPNDHKLMRKLKTIWNEFWFLREGGKWAELEHKTALAFRKYRNDPDVLVFLYRSEMCTSSFYRENDQKAQSMFKKAMALLPKAKMSSWHLGRLYALRIEMFIRKGQLAKAHKLVIEGRQEQSELAPCLSTGTLCFFEGLYYSDFLRRHCRGTKATEIFERAKKCFLMTLEHYKEERLFAVSTWRNEVYLFLTLLELHVDFKKFNDISFQRQDTTDFPMVQYYLDLFENECWEIATPWSKMLYCIARAKHQERLNNLQRCFDYYRQAMDHAEDGNFKDQIPIIDDCLDKVKVSLQNQQVLRQGRQFPSDDSSYISDYSDTDSIGGKYNTF